MSGRQGSPAERVIAAPVSPVLDRLLECALDYEQRARRPRVAWDQLGAETWGKVCRRWFDAYKDAPDKIAADREIIARLRAIQAGERDESTGLHFIVNFDVWAQIDRILDPVDQAGVRGWIELSASLDPGDDRPQFRRMLGLNHCVDGLRRGLPKSGSMFERLPETDADWLERRRAWLSRYHPDTWVVRPSRWAPDGEATQLVGRVRDLLDVVHLTETHDTRFAA